METFQSLVSELIERFRTSLTPAGTDDLFDELALRVFRVQYEGNAPFRAFADSRKRTPLTVTRWQDVPLVPTDAFKTLSLCAVPSDRVEATFRTSGTLRGRGRRGVHEVASLDLYEASSIVNLIKSLLPELESESWGGGVGDSVRVLALLPNPESAPDSSLSRMISFVGSRTDARPDWFVDVEAGLAHAEARAALEDTVGAGGVVFVVGTAFSFVHLVDRARAEGWSVRLPASARVMETGGFKGRSREVSRDALYQGITETLGVPRNRIVNEYGMTELLSQFYDGVVPGAGVDLDERVHVGPWWIRSRVLDPVTLNPVEVGEVGVLAHFDLANVGSVSHVLTSDLARARRGGFALVGRAPGAEPRGCSLAMEELMIAVDRRS